MSYIPFTQYTEGDTDATIRGTAVMFEAAADTLLPPSSSNPFPVGIISGGGGGVQYTEGDTDATITGTAIMWEDGSDTLRSVSAAKPLPISDAGGSLTVDGTVTVQDGGNVLSVDDAGGSITVDGSVAAVAAGDVAHSATDSGNPVKVGHKAVAHGSNPTAVDANDRTDWYSNRHGIPFMIGGHPNTISHAVQYTAAQTDAAIITVSSGTKIIVTRLLVTNDNSTSVDVSVRIGFGTANVPAYGNAGIVGSHPGLSAGGGFSTGDGSGIIGIGADGEDLRITCSVPTGGAIDCVVSYFTCES